MTRIAVFDYGVGNLRSVLRMVQQLTPHVGLTSDPRTILEADGLIVPGVGDFETVACALYRCHGDELISQRLSSLKPVLGICVGLQVFFSSSQERHAHTRGLGLWSGEVKKLQADIVPHMGWSRIFLPSDNYHGHSIFSGIENSYFYFAHSYAVAAHDMALRSWSSSPHFHQAFSSSPTFSRSSFHPFIALSHYGDDFIAAIEDGPLCATQFHPEKSGKNGMRLMHNWIKQIDRSNQ